MWNPSPLATLLGYGCSQNWIAQYVWTNNCKQWIWFSGSFKQHCLRLEWSLFMPLHHFVYFSCFVFGHCTVTHTHICIYLFDLLSAAVFFCLNYSLHILEQHITTDFYHCYTYYVHSILVTINCNCLQVTKWLHNHKQLKYRFSKNMYSQIITKGKVKLHT